MNREVWVVEVDNLPIENSDSIVYGFTDEQGAKYCVYDRDAADCKAPGTVVRYVPEPQPVVDEPENGYYWVQLRYGPPRLCRIVGYMVYSEGFSYPRDEYLNKEHVAALFGPLQPPLIKEET